MTINSVLVEMQNFLELLTKEEIAISTQPVVRTDDGNRASVSWPYRSQRGVSVASGEFATISQYMLFLRNQHYSAILFDGSIIQVTYMFSQGDLVGHRLGFLPCPFEVDQELLTELPILDVIDFYIQRGTEFLRLRSPVRFDYDRRNINKDHPMSHVHFLWPHCRCALVAPISIGHFVRFIFSHFYPDHYGALAFLREWQLKPSDRTITSTQENALHFAYKN